MFLVSVKEVFLLTESCICHFWLTLTVYLWNQQRACSRWRGGGVGIGKILNVYISVVRNQWMTEILKLGFNIVIKVNYFIILLTAP